MPFAETWLDLETVIQSEVRKEKKQIQYNITHVESRKMIQVNLFAKQKQRHRCRQQMQGHQGGEGDSINR